MAARSHDPSSASSGEPPIATPIPTRRAGGGGQPHGQRRRLAPAAHAELGQDAPDVVLGRLRRDEQARRDLGVRQTEAAPTPAPPAREHSAPTRLVGSLRPSARRVAEPAQQGRGPVAVCIRTEPLEAGQRCPASAIARRLAGSGEHARRTRDGPCRAAAVARRSPSLAIGLLEASDRPHRRPDAASTRASRHAASTRARTTSTSLASRSSRSAASAAARQVTALQLGDRPATTAAGRCATRRRPAPCKPRCSTATARSGSPRRRCTCASGAQLVTRSSNGASSSAASSIRPCSIRSPARWAIVSARCGRCRRRRRDRALRASTPRPPATDPRHAAPSRRRRGSGCGGPVVGSPRSRIIVGDDAGPLLGASHVAGPIARGQHRAEADAGDDRASPRPPRSPPAPRRGERDPLRATLRHQREPAVGHRLRLEVDVTEIDGDAERPIGAGQQIVDVGSVACHLRPTRGNPIRRTARLARAASGPVRPSRCLRRYGRRR